MGLNSCLVTVDGTDFPIVEPWQFELEFNRKFYSHKFKQSGLRYEVAIAVYTGDIVWFHGPFPCGAFNDLKIFSLKLQTMLPFREKVISDKGYRGNPFCMTPEDSLNEEHKKFMAKARARHETVNRRFKQWGCLKQLWRHDRKKHHFVFKVVATLVQIEFDRGKKPFQVDVVNDNVRFTRFDDE